MTRFWRKAAGGFLFRFHALGVLGRVRVHPLFVLLVVAAVASGLWQDVLILFLLVFLHELGHAAMAHHFGYEVEQVSLLPFGGVARLRYGNIGFIPRHEAAIAIAGPLVNVALMLFAWLLYEAGLWNAAFFTTVVRLNLWIVVFNLLPALPLDGGRVLRAARSRTAGYEKATREAYAMAVGIAVTLLLLGVVMLWSGYPHFGIVILAVFLFVAAWTGRKDATMDTVRFLDAKRRTRQVRPQVVRALAAPCTASVRDVVRQFAPDRYHFVYVLNRDGAVQTILEEDELLNAVFAGEWLRTLEMWIKRD